MKKSFAVFWKRNLAFAKLAIVTNLEYRVNYFIDALVQPIVTAGIELLLWFAVFKGANSNTIVGFTRENYLSYALWAAFFSRITTNWMYEFRMIEDVSSGMINSLLVRPVSFYEYYLSQLLGYKFITTVISLTIPIAVCYYFNLPLIYSRLPLAILLGMYFLILIHTIGYFISGIAFHFTKISAITVAKNLLFWILMGELFPLDMLPLNIKNLFIALPFSSGVFIPVGYVIGRVEIDLVYQGFISITVGTIVLGIISKMFWNYSLKEYTGTGA